MEEQTAKMVFSFLREGGLLGGLVLALLAVVHLFKKLLAEKDAHRQTSDVVIKLATELAGLMRDLNAKRNPRNRSPAREPGPESDQGPANG